MLAGAAPAAAICEQPTKAQLLDQKVRYEQEFRHDAGPPGSRAHIVRVLRSKHRRFISGGHVLSPREDDYLGRISRFARSSEFDAVLDHAEAQSSCANYDSGEAEVTLTQPSATASSLAPRPAARCAAAKRRTRRCAGCRAGRARPR